MAELITRRRTIGILAAAAGLPLLGGPVRAKASAPQPIVWHGQALGAPASLILNHPDPAQARKLVDQVVSELGRLEAIFSLYRDTSALNELNRNGALASPPPELVAMLEACAGAWAASGGAFDPTIQPLWRLYAQHFSSTDADPAGPTAVDLEEARSLVGFDAVLYNPDRIAFARRGMALTLNGIAQGFVTDAVVRLLRAEGITRSLVSMGESRAIGTAGDGRPWRVGLAEMEAGSKPDVVVELVDRAVATSSLSGFRFDSAGRFNHILDPKQGAIPQIYRRVSVIAPDATTADAFSTAFSLLDQTTIRTIVTKNPGMVVDLLDNKGVHMRV